MASCPITPTYSDMTTDQRNDWIKKKESINVFIGGEKCNNDKRSCLRNFIDLI